MRGNGRASAMAGSQPAAARSFVHFLTNEIRGGKGNLRVQHLCDRRRARLPLREGGSHFITPDYAYIAEQLSDDRPLVLRLRAT
jgi:hypothetical protein